MTGSAARIAWALCLLTVAAAGAQTAFLITAGVPLLSVKALDQAFPVITLAIVLGAVVGAAIVQRHPRHRIGWLFCLGQAGAAVGLAAQALAHIADRWGSDAAPPIREAAVVVAHVFGATYAFSLLGLLLVLSPDGRLAARRWWSVVGLLLVGFLLSELAFLLSPDQAGSRFRVGGPLLLVLDVGAQLTITAGLAGAVLALWSRLLRARGEERQQLRWINAAGGMLAVTLLVLVADNIARGGNVDARWFLAGLVYLGYLAVPVATGLAVLRHRLYDIDIIIGQAVRLAVLVVFVTVGYVASVVAIGYVLGRWAGALWPSLAAYAIVALAFQPLRRRIDRFADRVVYGRRAGPYENLADLSRELQATGRSEEEALSLVAEASARAAGARAAAATVVGPRGRRMSATWPPGGGSPTEDVHLPVRYQGKVLGWIDLGLAQGHSISRAQQRLAGGCAESASLAFASIGLTAQLRDRADAIAQQHRDLEASRRRLVTAGDLEREQVASAIRSTVSARLEPLPAAILELRSVVLDHPDAARLALERQHRSTTLAIEALRTVTTGLLPASLGRRGLAAALQALADQSRATPDFEASSDVRDRRFEPSVEAAVYLACDMAMAAMAAGPQVILDVSDERLVAVVRGRRTAELPDRQQVLDRVEAVGGQLDEGFSSTGDEVSVLIPVPRSAQTAASVPGPKAAFGR